jgi:opacity protein-like surface antigen
MKLLRLCAFVLVFAGTAAVADAQTADNPPRGNVSGFGTFAPSVSDGLDRGNGFGGSAAFFFSPAVGVEGGVRRQTFDVLNTEANSLSGGELTANVVSLNVVVRVASTGRVQPYATGGLALFLNSYAIDPALRTDLESFQFTLAETIDNAAGFNVGGGADILLSERLGVFIEGRYFAATADTLGSLVDNPTQITGDAPGEQKLNVFAVNGGIRIYF